MTKEIQLTQGKVALVSDHRYEYLNQFKWSAYKDPKANSWYAIRVENRKAIRMHREIMGVTNPKIEVDHHDHNGLNNQDENLRIATRSQNMSNRTKNSNNTSGYKGVFWDKQDGKYNASICVNKKRLHLGTFTDPAVAARAYDRKAKELFGDFACLNFQDGVL